MCRGHVIHLCDPTGGFGTGVAVNTRASRCSCHLMNPFDHDAPHNWFIRPVMKQYVSEYILPEELGLNVRKARA